MAALRHALMRTAVPLAEVGFGSFGQVFSSSCIEHQQAAKPAMQKQIVPRTFATQCAQLTTEKVYSAKDILLLRKAASPETPLMHYTATQQARSLVEQN